MKYQKEEEELLKIYIVLEKFSIKRNKYLKSKY